MLGIFAGGWKCEGKPLGAGDCACCMPGAGLKLGGAMPIEKLVSTEPQLDAKSYPFLVVPCLEVHFVQESQHTLEARCIDPEVLWVRQS